VAPLARALTDEDVEVRQMVAFALGLIGDGSARGALLAALQDPEPLVQGRAAEALGRIADRNDAGAVSSMVQAHVKGGALGGIAPDHLSYVLAPPVEAVRLGLYALVRLGSYDALAACVLDADGRPVSTWWPVAYALQRIADPRAVPALQMLADVDSRYTASFAVRGLGAAKVPRALDVVRGIVEGRRASPEVTIQALRALAAANDTQATALVAGFMMQAGLDPTLRLEAMTTFAALAGAEESERLVDLSSDRTPAIRGAAFRALARVDPETFLVTLSGLDLDRDWSVRMALATSLGAIPPEQGQRLLTILLADPDLRVVTAAMNALAASKAPSAETMLVAKLDAEDFAIRANAARLLGELTATGATQAVVGAYRRAGTDQTYVARAAALAALRALDPAAARPLLVEALADRDWAMRVRAAQLLTELGEVVAPDSIRPAPLRRPVESQDWMALASPKFSPHAFIETDKGRIEIELAVLDAPLTVDNFITLARRGFYNGLALHRVVHDFVVQVGDPRGDGEGGPGYSIRDEINERPYLRGTVGMALDWNDTGGSQFFITHSPQPHLDGRYTVFGYVVEGMDVVDALREWDVVQRVTIWDGVTQSP
jgi:cyclophilin family peptidyl-prolyl cis-trans isomerase/HEAT repeat protein